MIILIIIFIILFIGWPIFMIWYGSSECIESDYHKYVKRKIEEENKNFKL